MDIWLWGSEFNAENPPQKKDIVDLVRAVRIETARSVSKLFLEWLKNNPDRDPYKKLPAG